VKALFLENLPYDSDFRVGSHHYADHFLSDGWEALWASHPISPLHYLRSIKKDWDVRVRGWRQGPLDYGALRYVSPFTLLPAANLPLLRSDWVVRHSIGATVPNIARLVGREGFGTPDLVWLTNTFLFPLVAETDHRCLAVRVPDDTSRFVNVPSVVKRLEEEAFEAADLLFVVSHDLHAELVERHPNAIRLPNGVDFAHFSKTYLEPVDLASIPGPRVLYVGGTEYWFDAELVRHTAAELLDVSFVIIGPDSTHLDPLRDSSNVHLLGPRPYVHVPAYMQYSDVGIIPFRRDPMVDRVHPVKLYEYLAAGLPTVSIRWPEIERMDSPVRLVEPEGFVEGIRSALGAGDDEREGGRCFAVRNSWDERFTVVRSSIEEVLKTRS